MPNLVPINVMFEISIEKRKMLVFQQEKEKKKDFHPRMLFSTSQVRAASLPEKSMASATRSKVAIAGAGIAGLWLTDALARSGVDVVLFEAADRIGGRVRTVRDENHRVAYEAGPWRVPASHARLRRLCRRAGLTLTPAPTSPLPHSAGSGTPELTEWDRVALDTGDALTADEADLATGYAGQLHAGVRAYDTSPDETFFVVPEGLGRLSDFLVVEDVLQRSTRVVDCARTAQGGYRLDLRRRVGHNSYEDASHECDAVFVCVPPSVWGEWSAMREHAHSLRCAVESGPLHHVYVQDGGAPRGRHVLTPILAQSISSQYAWSDWFQASYSGGRVAQMWHRLALHSPRAFFERIRHELRYAMGIDVSERAQWKSEHWPEAYHVWRAVPRFDLQRAIRMAIEPNPLRLPRVYVAGEAFSGHQAWIEGALQTAEMALERFRHPNNPDPQVRPRRWVRIEGRTVDVDAWMERHPGGIAPLQNHLGEDVTDLMRDRGHSAHAWACARALMMEA